MSKVVMRTWLYVAALLIPCWLSMLVAAYWLIFDVSPPLELVYQAPRFTREPARTRAEADEFAIDAVASGGAVWIYRELCVQRSMAGRVVAVWSSGAFLWQTPERSVPQLEKGCSSRSFMIQAPISAPSREFVYQAAWLYDVNPFTTAEVVMPAVHLEVIAK